MTKKELLKAARNLGIIGRDKMSKAELEVAIGEAEAAEVKTQAPQLDKAMDAAMDEAMVAESEESSVRTRKRYVPRKRRVMYKINVEKLLELDPKTFTPQHRCIINGLAAIDDASSKWMTMDAVANAGLSAGLVTRQPASYISHTFLVQLNSLELVEKKPTQEDDA